MTPRSLTLVFVCLILALILCGLLGMVVEDMITLAILDRKSRDALVTGGCIPIYEAGEYRGEETPLGGDSEPGPGKDGEREPRDP